MAVMLICQLPVTVLSDDDVIDRSTVVAVSVVKSRCERPSYVLRPVDLRRRRSRRRKLSELRHFSASGPAVDYLVDFAICVPPLFGNVKATNLVEFIEVYMQILVTHLSRDGLRNRSKCPCVRLSVRAVSTFSKP